MTPTIYRPEERPSLRQSLSTFQATNRTPSLIQQQQQQQQQSLNELSIQSLNNIQLNDDFFTVQSAMKSNIDWIKVDTATDPICVITSSAPYLFLKPSKSLAILLDYSPEDLFGQSLYTLSYSPSVTMDPNVISQNKLALDTFCNELNTINTSHIAITLYTSNSIPIDCLIHAFPIYYQEVIYREYYSNLVSVVQNSIGTTFSSENYDFQAPSIFSPHIINKNNNNNNNNNNNQQQQREVLYYQLHFSKIEPVSPVVPETENTIMNNITRIFSTGSLRNSTLLQNRNTDISSGSGENKSGNSTLSGSVRRSQLNSTDKLSSKRSVSAGSSQRNNSQSTVSLLNSHSGNNPEEGNDNPNEDSQNSNNSSNKNKRNSTTENILTVTERINEDIRSEKSFEYDNLERGVMLERTNTLNSGRSIPTDDGWNQKF